MKRRFCTLVLFLSVMFPLLAENMGYRTDMGTAQRETFQNTFGVELRFTPVHFLLTNPLPLSLGSWANLNEEGMSFFTENFFQISDKLLLKTEVLSDFQKKNDGNAQLLDGEASIHMDVQYEVKKDLWIGIAGTIPVTIEDILLAP